MGFERSFWDQRHQPNILMVHYKDMKTDLESEMRRIAAFLDVDCARDLWSQLVEAARFESMQRDGALLMPQLSRLLEHGARSFFFEGRNGRWRDMLTAEDLVAYDAKVAASLSPECAHWVEDGRLLAGDP